MARVYSTGFELNSATTGMEADTFSSVTVSTTQVRSGTYALRCNTGGGFWRNQVYAADSATAIAYVRFYIYLASTPSVNTQCFRIATSANSPLVSVNLTTTGALQLLNNLAVQIGSNSTALSTGTWYRIEVSYNPATGSTEAYVDGSSFASGTTTTGSWSRVLLGSINGTPTVDHYFDDVAVNDDSGSSQNGLPGSGKIIRLTPNAAGDINTFATQTGGTAGAANNYTRVDEVTPNDATDFNGSSTLNQEDLFNVTDSGINSYDTVNVVAIGARFRNSTADATAAFRAEVEKTASGTKTQSASVVPNSTTWRTNSTATPFNAMITTYLDPDGAAWTQSTLDSMQIGYKLTTAPGTAGRRIDVSAVWALVDYTPGTPPAGGTPIRMMMGMGT